MIILGLPTAEMRGVLCFCVVEVNFLWCLCCNFYYGQIATVRSALLIQDAPRSHDSNGAVGLYIGQHTAEK